MKRVRIQWVVRQALCLVCVSLLAVGLLVAQQPGPSPQAPAQFLSPQQLDTMVAPVALYPDALLSQVLVASTYPLEIAEAAQWLQQNGNLQGPQLVDAARQQNWDPSIQALVVFPDVVNRLNSDIRWTTALGNVFLAQQADVMNAVQRMRAQAMAAGKLRSTGEQTVTTEMQGDQSAFASTFNRPIPRRVYVLSLQSPVHLGAAGLRLLPAVGLRGHRFWTWIRVRPWHLHWRFFRRPGMGWLGLGAELVPSLHLSEPVLFRSVRFWGAGNWS